VAPKKGKRPPGGIFGGITVPESFEVFEHGVGEGLVDAGIQSTTARGVSKQTVHGKGYEVRVTRTKEGPATIVVVSDLKVRVVVNGKEVGCD